MPIQIISGNSSDIQIVDPTGAGRTTLYGADGAELSKTDRASITPVSTKGVPIMGSNYKDSRLARVQSDGSLMQGRSLELFDRMEGAAYNSNKWIQTATTMTAAQVAGILTLNSGSTTTTTTGIMLTSHKLFVFSHRQSLSYRCVMAPTAHASNNLIEAGFGSVASVTAATVTNGAFWRKDGTGQWIPVIAIGASEIQGTPISNASFISAIPAGQYAVFEVIVTNTHAEFAIYTNIGVLAFSQELDWQVTISGFTSTRLQAFERTYNSGTTSPAVQVLITDVNVFSIDYDKNRSWCETQAGNAEGGVVTSPTAYTQLETYANNAAPATATPSNTAAAIATLGGLAAWNNAGTSFAASDTLDLIIYGAAVPSPYGLMLKGIRIDSMNLGAANGAAAYVLQWFLAVNSSALSLATAAPYSPMKKALGFQYLAASAAIGTQFTSPIDVRFNSGIYVFPGRFVVVGCRVIGASAATSSQVIRTACTLDGYFE